MKFSRILGIVSKMWGNRFQVYLTTNSNLFSELLDQLVCLAKTRLKYYVPCVLDKNRKYQVSYPLTSKS